MPNFLLRVLSAAIRLTIDHSSIPSCFCLGQKTLPIKKFNNELKDFDGCNTIDTQNSKLEMIASKDVTLYGQDIFFMPVWVACTDPGLYEVILHENYASQGLVIEGSSQLMFAFVGRDKAKVHALIHLRLDREKWINVCISALSVLGEIVQCKKNENAEILFVEAKVKNPEANKVYIYPVRFMPTKGEIKAVRNAQMERSKKWTREDLKSESKGWIENIPENYQDDVLDLLEKYSSIMVKDLGCLKHGLLFFELKGIIPKDLFLASHYRTPSLVMRNLFARTQKFMVETNLAEVTQTPLIIHPYQLTPKKDAVFPADEASCDKMTDFQLRKSYHIVNDCSLLNQFCPNLSIGYLPSMSEALNTVRHNTIISLSDLDNSFHQIRLTNERDQNGHCVRDLFSFYSQISGVLYIRNTRLTMGYSNASDLSSNIFRRINEPINMTPLCWSLGEYEEFIERYEDSENKLESHGKKLYSIQIRSYLDDSLIQSPMYEELLGHDLSKNSYFKVPKCKTDHAVYLHLNVLSKIFSNLRDITC